MLSNAVNSWFCEVGLQLWRREMLFQASQRSFLTRTRRRHLCSWISYMQQQRRNAAIVSLCDAKPSRARTAAFNKWVEHVVEAVRQRGILRKVALCRNVARAYCTVCTWNDHEGGARRR